MSVLESISDDIAAELQAARYWGETQRVLDGTSTDDLIDKAQHLLATANHIERTALRQELIPYLTARGIPPTVSDYLSPTQP
ncbi:hypothetical protein [Gordonia sp. 'Campus']|uniref:hypothetical protein n=1 Tax=Gordonia sp. 'Campus' TaxID=2915824 RepID=UPI001EE3E349|nr:hypothetical protein [Gordonia sp. 'Campus']